LFVAKSQGEPQDQARPRARPPQWSKAVTDIFFPDARKKLVGERPDYANNSPKAAGASAEPASSNRDDAPTVGTDSSWSEQVSRESLEDEVKLLQKLVSENITTPTKFKGGGYKAARRHFTELALLFGIIAQYDGDVRWKDNASGIRDLMARVGQNCAVGTDASYNEAKLRKDDLEQIVRGGTIQAPQADPDITWNKIADRPPLMQRLELAQQQVIAPGIANATEFSKSADRLLREAELVAVIAHVIQQEGFDYADDETYLNFARQLQEAAQDVVGAIRDKDYNAARAASGNIEKACNGCHEGYRS
jgi:hypothetical protein